MKTKIFFCFLILPVLVHAQSVHFENSLNEAFEKAVLENKPVFIEYYNSECPVCKKLQPIFNDQKLGEFYNSHFVNYRLNTKDMKTEDSLFMASSKLKMPGYPYFLFFDANKNFLHHSDTKPEVDYLIEIGEKALNPDERDACLEKKYKNGDRSIKTLFAYSMLIQLYKNDSLTTILADDLFKSFPKNELGSKKSYIITKNCVKSIDNGFFKYWIRNLDKLQESDYEKHKGDIKQRFADIVFNSIYSKERDNWSLEKIAEVKKDILITELSANPGAYFWEQETKLLVEKKRYDDAFMIGRHMLDEEKTGISASVDIIHHFIDILTTTNELNTVKKWIDEITSRTQNKSDEADIMYLNALYYIKTNQTKLARNTIDSALVFYKKNSIDTKLLTGLMNTK